MSNDLGIDRSGNNNHWSVNNMTILDQMLDTPTNNFCTMNPLVHGSAATYKEGNLKIETPNYPWSRGTFVVSSGKWYWEWRHYAGGGACYIGICNDNRTPGGDLQAVANVQSWVGHLDGNTKNWTDSTTDNSISGIAIGDILSAALDLDGGSIKWYKNNVLIHTDSTLPAGEEVTPMLSATNDGANPLGSWWGDVTFNFGQDSSFAGEKTAQGNQDDNEIGDFYYTPPSGFLALCTSNLPEPAVKPSQHFNTVIWSGDGNHPRTISGVGFQPDLNWIKLRSNWGSHYLFDAVRGAGEGLMSNDTIEEESSSVHTAFTSGGFTLGDPGITGIGLNETGDDFVAWNWKANGSGSANSNGSTNSTVSANTDAGFSIVSYTGTGSNATVGHGLSVAPEMVIVKSRSSVESWICYTEATGNTGYLPLNATSAFSSSSTMFNNTSPTASLFTVGTNNATNSNTQTYIAYCFHSVDDYSKVGSYVGNGSTDGTFIYTGFRPAYVMWKETSAGTHGWMIHDNARSTYNPSSNYLRADSAGSEGSYPFADFTSNGFKQRHTSTWANGNGVNYIYIAFAETPFKYSNAK